MGDLSLPPREGHQYIRDLGFKARIQRGVDAKYLGHDERHVCYCSIGVFLQTTDIGQVLYSVDHPFSSNEKGLKFFEKVRSSGLLSEDVLENFAYRNAEELLGVKADKVM
ncbi:metal-dependent hydrolase [Penicillium frequentans]|uniref:Metal-dependent hydrolase n=1 Tax=Penicillium frequentans TaxID=3151616 RepID=A0AAD6GJ60_9EURO|nr:metal-dependent hydrolase [Penicillium glabrum]